MFEWHKAKEILNIKKHNITFVEASTIFDDYFALYIEDEVHSNNEDRFVVIGYSNKGRLLTTVITERYSETKKIIRIISARKSTKNERKIYERKSKYN